MFLSKLKNKFTKEEKDKEKTENENKDYDEAFADLVVKYIIENFDKIEINNKESFTELKNKFDFFKKEKNILKNLKPFTEKNIEEKEGHNSFIDYVKNDDCLLMINKNKLKIIKREENGLFDLTNFLDIKNDQPHMNYIIFEKQDLIYFLQNFDVKGYINYFPSFNKIHCLFSFLDSITNGFTFGKNKIILSQRNCEFFYSSIISFLNFSAFITKRNKNLKNKPKIKEEHITEKEKEQSQKNLEKEKMEKENLNLMNVLPMGYFENEIEYENEELSQQIFDDSNDTIINNEDLAEFISKNPLAHAKLVKIVNKIMAQISI